MLGIIAAEIIWIAGGCFSLLAGHSFSWATRWGAGSAVLGCIVAFFPTLTTLMTGKGEKAAIAWSLPGASFSIGIDPLSAFFLFPILILTTTAAVYGGKYMLASCGQRRLGYPWFLFNLMVASMTMVVISRNVILFLMAWELLTLSCAFLVMYEDQKKEVRDAGWLYLIATHLGSVFLLPFFVVLSIRAGSLEFDFFEGHRAGSALGFLFLFGIVGFGTKAGFMPFHVWLPEAHPAAPSHVSALMSGVIIKTGIYGIVRSLGFFEFPPAWWGWTLISIGAVSGILGVLMALVQHDLKRLLAYHSVENIGIIAMGLGIGLLGVSYGSPPLAILGFGGGLLHVVNHAMFKGLLFLGAGAVAQASGTRNIDRMGGLLRHMPWTGFFFLVASVAIAGLPPLNGFVSELLIYAASFSAVVQGHTLLSTGGIIVIISLALIGGLAAACFTKAFGMVFLGTPRHHLDIPLGKETLAMVLPMGVLATGCIGVGLSTPLLPHFLGPVLSQVTGLAPTETAIWPAPAESLLKSLLLMAWTGIALAALAAGVRLFLLHGRKISAGSTWDCGYIQPTPRIQYSSSSFAQPLTTYFQRVLGTRKHGTLLFGFFPEPASFHTETPDAALKWIYLPIFSGIRWMLGFFRWLQNGRVQFYVLYVVIALLFLLVWTLGLV